MLRIFRRHRAVCTHRSEHYRRCACPIYVEGTLGYEYVRKTLDQTSWQAATELVAAWTASGRIGYVQASVPTIPEAVEKFLADCRARGLQSSTVAKQHRLLAVRLCEWCERQKVGLLRYLDLDALRQFRGTGLDGPLSARKNIERLRTFFVFCQEAGWIDRNPAKHLKPPKMPERSARVKVFSTDDLTAIFAACDRYPERNAFGYDNRARMKALVLTLRYSGLRVGDCVSLQKAHLRDDKLFLNTQKTGTRIYVPLPAETVGALERIQSGNAYFFWSGNGLLKSAVADWQRSLRRLFDLADVVGHPHMFRHTFATDLLARGIPIEDVAALIGHRSVVVTQSYYSHWVSERRERLEQRIRELWPR